MEEYEKDIFDLVVTALKFRNIFRGRVFFSEDYYERCFFVMLLTQLEKP